MSRCDSCRYQNDFEFHACHICHMEKDMYKPKKTNADRFRAMSDEELADELLEWFACFYAVEWSREQIINYLKQEVT